MEIHFSRYIFSIFWCIEREILLQQVIDGLHVFWSDFLQHQLKLDALVGSSDDKAEQDEKHQDKSSEVPARQCCE
jgi:hypothetical protein